MDILNTEFKRQFAVSFYKNLKIKLSEMTFLRDFASAKDGNMYPIVYKSADCEEKTEYNRYKIKGGKVKRIIGSFFPYATYEMSASVESGKVGFSFIMPASEASVAIDTDSLIYACGKSNIKVSLPEYCSGAVNLIVSCRPGAFDIYFKRNGKAEYFRSFDEDAFANSHQYSEFSVSKFAIFAEGNVEVQSIASYIDNGISIADMRPIRYENGDVMVENGHIYITASIRMQSEKFQGVFSWIPGTSEFELTGALFYDSGDGMWCGDVAASVLYHRGEKRWYLWICSFSHGHILGHSVFEGDIRFGVNVVDIKLMEKAGNDSKISDFMGFSGDEDPDFFYDEKNKRWLMTVCRIDRDTDKYRYVFFESDKPFDDYRFIGMGPIGDETGGTFVKIDGEIYFICGNSFDLTSDYRIYHKGGMTNAKFDYPDGGFRGWGTLMPIKLGSRTRYFWLTFDRHAASDYTWSYGNLYCFEA